MLVSSVPQGLKVLFRCGEWFEKWWVGRLQTCRRGLDGGVLTQVEEGCFEGLGQAEGSWSGCWFVPGEVFIQGCGEGGELFLC